MQQRAFEDNHIHSTYSDGAFTLEEIFAYNRTHDRLGLTLSDHVDTNTDWYPTYVQHIRKLRAEYTEFNARIGCEVKILDDGSLNTTDEILEAAEVVLGSVHHFEGIKTMPPAELIAREYELTKLLAENSVIDVLAHPFNMGVRFHKSDVPREWVEDVYERCVKNGVLFEYNHTRAPLSVQAFVRELVAAGTTEHLSFGGDMHTELSQLGISGFQPQKTIPVLVTGAGAGVGQSILKALKLSRVPLRILMADMSERAAGLYAGDGAYLIPGFRDPAYLSRIVEICQTERVQLIFAGTDLELEILSENAAQLEAVGTRVVVSNSTAVRIADDKWKTVQFLKENGFPYADSALVPELAAFMETATFPLIVKPRVGARSIGLYKVENQEELDAAVARTPDAIIQEYLSTEDDEYTCSAFFYDGKCYGVMTGKRWLRNGDTYKTIFTHDAELEAFIAEVGAKLDLFGPCNFQLRKTEKGPVIFEINCRFSGTTGAMSFLGFNVANALVQILCLGRAPSTLHFKDAWMFRYWNEIFTDIGEVDALGRDGMLSNPSGETNVFN